MHGGAAGSGAPKGKRNGMYRHGMKTGEAVAERAKVRAILKNAAALLDKADGGQK
jgi:hypothetical protein